MLVKAVITTEAPFQRRFTLLLFSRGGAVKLANHLSSKHDNRLRIASPLLRMCHQRPKSLVFAVAVTNSWTASHERGKMTQPAWLRSLHPRYR
jgi:hypothetical protein